MIYLNLIIKAHLTAQSWETKERKGKNNFKPPSKNNGKIKGNLKRV